MKKYIGFFRLIAISNSILIFNELITVRKTLFFCKRVVYQSIFERNTVLFIWFLYGIYALCKEKTFFMYMYT